MSDLYLFERGALRALDMPFFCVEVCGVFGRTVDAFICRRQKMFFGQCARHEKKDGGKQNKTNKPEAILCVQ